MEENQEIVDERIEIWCQHLETRNTQDILTTLQDISNNYHPPMQQIDDKVQEKFRQLILHLLSQPSANQILLNSSLRTYFHILHRAGIVDVHFQDLDVNPNYAPFVLYAILSTDYHKCLEQDFLQEKCLQALSRAIRSNFSHLVPVLRALNLLCKKYSLPTLDISLETFYSCLQSNRFGARDEALVLFRYSTTGLQPTVKLFNLIINYWPWTNKNKYYLLSVILTNHKLQSLSENCAFDGGDFFNGLRLGLSYKSTFSASQSLVRALSKQHNHELLELSTDILRNGTEREIVNFHTQWFTHILQKDELYRMMDLHDLREVSFRYTFLVYLFSKQIVLTSKEMLNELANFLRNTSYQLTIETQMYVFRFFVDNLSALEFPNCLEYLSDFIEAHRCTECPQIRHMILGKFPTIFNFIAKVFCTLKSDSHPPVRAFFRRLIQMVLRDMQTSTLYQPLIFSLKAMDRILQILFSSSSKNVSKACKLDQNHKLGEYLVSEKIFDVHAVSRTAFDVLNSSECYDDARELVVNIIKQMKVQSLRDASRRCGECSESVEIDEVAQCRVFARLCIQCGLYNGEKEYSRELLIYSMRRVQDILRGLEVDPLSVCKNEGHIFGHMSVINEVLSEENSSLGVSYKDLLQMVEDVISLHLKLLNAAAGKDGSTAASFQVMDESLQLLVEQSSYDQEEAEDCRKFLMLSFWMALKTSCEVATTIGSIVMGEAEADSVVLKIVEKCLNASVTVLLRCRHKGAIEAAGVTLGKLIKLLTTHPEDSKCYGAVYKCLDLLFENVNQISTTRRGAGLTIMFLHLVKNEARRERPLFHRAIKMLLSRIENTKESIPASEVQPLSFDEPEQNFDSVHALVLHYLCVIVKDTEIRDTVSEYYDEIMIAAILRIDNPEWIICNAALQLFGALVPKIVGQKQATEMSEPVCWEPTEVTFLEVALKLPRTCEHVLHICSNDNKSNVSTRKIILFLEFLSNVEHLHKGEESISPILERFRELFWSLLSHACEKVRKLAATCFVRAHEFREDLPVVLLQLAEIIFKVRSENFFQGLLFALKEGIHKIDVEWKFTSTQGVDEFLELLRNTFRTSYKYRLLSFYTRALLVDFFLLTGLDLSEKIVMEIIQKEQPINEAEKNAFGFDLWRERVLEHKA